jgi:hypothetical protein
MSDQIKRIPLDSLKRLENTPAFKTISEKLSGVGKRIGIDPRKKVIKKETDCIDCNLPPKDNDDEVIAALELS